MLTSIRLTLYRGGATLTKAKPVFVGSRHQFRKISFKAILFTVPLSLSLHVLPALSSAQDAAHYCHTSH